jgi:hypothetical protein
MYPFVSMFTHDGIQNDLNEEKPPWSEIEQNVVPYTSYITWFFFYDWFPTIFLPLYFI